VQYIPHCNKVQLLVLFRPLHKTFKNGQMKQESTQVKVNFPEVEEAMKNGYQQSFISRPTGLLVWDNNNSKFYEPEDMIVQLVICTIQATLYLIQTKDGLYKGTFIDYWDV
jgi:hypothetical protein